LNKAFENWYKTVELKWILTGIAGYALTTFLGVYLIIKPQSSNYLKAVENQIGINETYINLLNLDIEKAISIVEAQLGELNLLKFRFKGRLFKNASLNSLTPVIDRYSVKAKMKVIKLESLDKTKFVKPNYEKLFMVLNLEGKYSNFLKLLKMLESHPEWLLVEDFTISPHEKGLNSKVELILSIIKEKGAA